MSERAVNPQINCTHYHAGLCNLGFFHPVKKDWYACNYGGMRDIVQCKEEIETLAHFRTLVILAALQAKKDAGDDFSAVDKGIMERIDAAYRTK